ncbi:MAG: TetR/AcrR family transcriptional regulator [Bacteroidia bacterium]|nr:TetR/AcrR family transcriptional regulator [Bacteroidia bacterium]
MKKMNAFTQALFTLAKEKPVAKISIEELCVQTGVKRQTFYYHFDDMGHFVSAVITDLCRRQQNIGHTLVDDATFIVELFATNHVVFKNLLTSPYVSDVTKYLYKYLSDNSYGRLSSDLKYKKLPVEQLKSVSRIMSSVIVSEATFWITSGMQEEQEHLINRFSIILEGVEKIMVENALRDNMNRNRRIEIGSDKPNKN